MAALTNATKAADIAKSLDIEMVQNFKHEYDRLAEILGIIRPEVVKAGQAMYQYTVTGALDATEYAEGDEVALSKYSVVKTPIGEISVKPYRKSTTAQAILKGGYENSIIKTDKKMLKDVRADVISRFFNFVTLTGEQFSYGSTLQAALAKADAVLETEMENTGDTAERIIHFVNRFDIADHLATAAVTTQTAFGMTYIESFLGVDDIFVTSKVPQGKVFATPTDNVHVYGIDFATLGNSNLEYTTQGNPLIGVHHSATYNRVSAETNVLCGMDMIAEVKNYIVESRIGGDTASLNATQLKAFADARGISYGSHTSAADILGDIKTALPNFV